MAKKGDSTNRATAPVASGSSTEDNSTQLASPTAAGSRKRAAVPKPAKFSQSEIALKAYYIGEARRKMGLPGDETSDWLEAERQLKGGKAPSKKTAAKPSRA